MDFVLEPNADDGADDAARVAAARSGIDVVPLPLPGRAAWWRAGVAEAVGRDPTAVRPPEHQEVALSPRSSRGATRA